jgi:hypothetical protein
VEVCFIGGGNWSTWRKPQTCHKSLTNGYDLGFGVYQRTKDKKQHAGKMVAIIPTQRVDSHLVPEDGSVAVKEPGMWRKLEYLEKTSDLPQVTDKLYHIIFQSTPRHERDCNSQHQW